LVALTPKLILKNPIYKIAEMYYQLRLQMKTMFGKCHSKTEFINKKEKTA